MDREQLKKIGFNTSLEADPRKVMVQTEVVGQAEVTIRTTVLHRGVAQSVEKQPCSDASDIDQIREAARAQHERIVERETHGG
jgi:hypothetical protein